MDLNRMFDRVMDKKAKEILFKTYWSSDGWISNEKRRIEQADFIYAKEKGLMFDTLTISKTELVARIDQIIHSIALKTITDAFICSLTNKRPDWRSGLGSFANAKFLLTNKNVNDYYFGHGENEDLNILNFERIKWGGVRHDTGLYNLLDLELLNMEIIPNPTNQAIDILQSILNVINSSQAEDTPRKLRDDLKEVFEVSKDERHVLIEILACAEIIKPLKYDRKEPAKHDWKFALYWRGEDKYNKENVEMYFGKYGIK
jgi:hypothetical protein